MSFHDQYKSSIFLCTCVGICVFICTIIVVSWNTNNTRITDNNKSKNKEGNWNNFRSTKELNLQRTKRNIADPECSTNITVDSAGGELHSPRYPEHYASNLDCQWILTSSTESKLILKFHEIQIEFIETCEYDYIEIYDDEFHLLERICGSHANKIVNTNSTTVIVVFHSDPSYTDKGFLLEYFMDIVSDCPKILNENEGILTSPLYPEKYPDKTDCMTQIVVRPGFSISLKFNDLSLEFDTNCSYDFVAIYDGVTTDSPLLGRFCSDPGNTTILSTNNTMLVHFHSDYLLNYHGFSANYKSVLIENDNVGECKWKRSIKSGIITSPNYPHKYPSDASCTITIKAPKDHVISFILDAVSMEKDDNCSYDKLKIRNGPNKDSSLLAVFCGRLNENTNITSTNNTVLVTFTSDNFAEFSGFQMRYWIHKPGDNMTILDIEGDSMEVTNAVTKPPKLKPGAKDSLSPEAFSEIPRNTSVLSGQSHVMYCKPKDSSAKIRWLKDNQLLGGSIPLPNLSLLDKGTLLWIHSMSANLKGIYTCAAVMPDGVSYSIKISIEMTEQPKNCTTILKKGPKNATMMEGNSDLIECSSLRQSTSITWTKNGHPINPSEHYQFLINGFLFIINAVSELSGIYTCIVEDKAMGCKMQASALVFVRKKIDVERICGRPVIGQPERGKPQMVDLGKVVGGHKTQRGAHPWQVMFWTSTRRVFCGGSLLNERWVVSAAHCFHVARSSNSINKNMVSVKLAKYNQYQEEDEEIVTGIDCFIIHPEYRRRIHDNDIALVRLLDPVHFSNYIKPVCLGDENFIKETFLKNPLQMGTVTGWGYLKEGGQRSTFLQEIRLPVADWNECKQSTRYVVTKNMFCAGYTQEIIGDACKGDSGGPFVMEHEGVWYLIGIVSWGDGCGREGQYGFYTKVNNYHSWIKRILVNDQQDHMCI